MLTNGSKLRFRKSNHTDILSWDLTQVAVKFDRSRISKTHLHTVFTAPLLTIIKRRKQPKYPSAAEWTA
jgi:hypothetical protein